MPTSIWETIASTSWWYFVFVACLCKMAFAASKPHIIPIKRAYFFPSLFFIVSMITLYFIIPFNFMHFTTWSCAILLGMIIGWMQFTIKKIKVMKNPAQLHFPGSWNLFLVIFVLLVTKFYFNFDIFFDVEQLKQPPYSFLLVFSYGLVAGLFAGRLIYITRSLKRI